MEPEIVQNKYAGFWRRFFASLVDGVIISIIGIGVSISLGHNPYIENPPETALWTLDYGLTMFLTTLYSMVMLVKSNGQTLGMKLLQIKMTDENFLTNIGWGTVIVRYIVSIVSAIVLLIGYIWMIFDSKKQTWHDKAAHTVVIETGTKLNTFLVVVIVILCLLFEGGQSRLRKQSNPQTQNTKTTTSSSLSQTSEALSKDILPAINAVRQESNVKPIVVSQQLCAYAGRRLEQLSKNGKFDDGRGFYEDGGNQQLMAAYYDGNFTSRGELLYVPHTAMTAQGIADYWKKNKIDDPKMTQGCVRGDNNFIIFEYVIQ